ncbi:MAG: ester cyclase [Bacteroidota bacterium]
MVKSNFKIVILGLTFISTILSCSTKQDEKQQNEKELKMEKSRSPGQKFIEGFGNNNIALLNEVLAEDVIFYGTLAWGLQGRENLINFAAEFHKGLPGMKVVLHDEFYNSSGSRGQIRMHLHFENTGIFMGHQPTGKTGESVESFTLKIKDDKITEIVLGGNNHVLAALELIDFQMEFPTDTPDPEPAILSASNKEVIYH